MQQTHDDTLHQQASAAVQRHAGAGRPRLTLTDDQARSLIQQLGAIRTRHADNPRQHRPFVRDFLRAVYHATGRIYSAGYYRKLLQGFAPERTPSTPTIETEKNLLEHDLKSRVIPGGDVPAVGSPLPAPQDLPTHRPERGSDLAQQQIIGLLQHLAARLDQLQRTPTGDDRAPGLQSHNDYLRERLAETQTELANARALAARMAASAQEATSQAEERALQLAVLQKNVTAQAEATAAMATELHGIRVFAMQAVDGVRGETRVARERCAQLEQQLKEKELQVDMYRQMAFSKGAPAR